MNNTLVFLFMLLPCCTIFSQIKILESEYDRIISNCILAVNDNFLIVENALFAPSERIYTRLIEINDELKTTQEFSFQSSDYPNATVLHISKRNETSYNVLFAQASENQQQRLYIGTISNHLDEITVVDSILIDVVGVTYAEMLEVGTQRKYYYSGVKDNSSPLPMLLTIENSTNLIESNMSHIIPNYTFSQIRTVKSDNDYTMMSGLSSGKLFYFNNEGLQLSHVYDICWLEGNDYVKNIGNYDFTFTENGKIILSGQTSISQDNPDRTFSVAVLDTSTLVETFCENEPGEFFVQGGLTMQGYNNAICQNEETKEIWAIGSTTHQYYLGGVLLSNFPTNIIVHKFDANGNHLFKREYPMDMHAGAWDCMIAPDNGLVIVGSSYDYILTREYDGFIMKLTQDGDLLPTSIEGVDKNGEISVFPNPTSGELHLTLPQSLAAPSYKVEVFNTLGQSVLQIQDLKESTLDVSNLTNGIYILTLTTKEGRNYYTKFEKL